jgi:hypothetical protein
VAAPLVDQLHDTRHELLRREDLDFHPRLEDRLHGTLVGQVGRLSMVIVSPLRSTT